MNVAVIDEPGETLGRDVDPLADDVRNMTAAQLRRLGVPMVVYLRVGTMHGMAFVAVH